MVTVIMEIQKNCNLQPLVTWPDAGTLRENMPVVFRKHFSDVRCIIDCFEIFIQRPVSFQARAATYSNYKKHNYVKILIGISPSGCDNNAVVKR